MKQTIYSMQFKGTAAPEEGSSNVLKAATKAPSCNIFGAFKRAKANSTEQRVWSRQTLRWVVRVKSPTTILE